MYSIVCIALIEASVPLPCDLSFLFIIDFIVELFTAWNVTCSYIIMLTDAYQYIIHKNLTKLFFLRESWPSNC